MIRGLSFILVLLLALPALAHSFASFNILCDCQSRADATRFSSFTVDSAPGSDTKLLSEEIESKSSAQCQMPCAIFAEMTAPTVAPDTQEHDTEFKPVLLFNIGYVVPRPPDAHA